MPLDVKGQPDSTMIKEYNAGLWKRYAPGLKAIFAQLPSTTILYGCMYGQHQVIGTLIPLGEARRV